MLNVKVVSLLSTSVFAASRKVLLLAPCSCYVHHPYQFTHLISFSLNKAFTDIRHRPGIATPLSPYGPLRLNVTSSIKPEVHNVSQVATSPEGAKPRPRTGDLHKKFRDDRSRGWEICSRTNRQTDRRVDHNTPTGRSNHHLCVDDTQLFFSIHPSDYIRA